MLNSLRRKRKNRVGRALPLKSQTGDPPFSVLRVLPALYCKYLLPKCQYTLTNRKGGENHEKTTQLERLLLKMVCKIVNMFSLIFKMLFYVFKLKKEVLAI